MFCTSSLPRKWSIRKIWVSSNTEWSSTLRARAESRSVPNGFSRITRTRSPARSVAPMAVTTSLMAKGGTER